MKPYTIQRGDSLAKIARTLGLADGWRPLWRYNTDVYDRLPGTDPEVIPDGVTILIPRSRLDYDGSIDVLVDLRRDLHREMQGLVAAVDAVKGEATRVQQADPFPADARIGGGAVRTTLTVGGARVASYKLTEKSANAAGKLAEFLRGLDQGGAAGWALEDGGEARVDESVVALARRRYDAAKAGSVSTPLQSAYMVARASGPVECAGGLEELIAALAHVAVDGVDGLQPSLASNLDWLTAVEDAEQAAIRAKDHIRRRQQTGAQTLSRAIDTLRQQQRVVYG